MFINRIYKTLIIALFLLSSSSCNKYLDLRPENGITVDEFWQTKEHVRSAVFGIYNGLITGNGGKSPAENFFTWGEVRADYVVPGLGITAEENSIVNYNLLPAENVNNTVMSWQPMYRIINLCNNLIENAPKVLSRDKTFTQATLDGYLGEAYAIRALMYFYLVRSFRDVPLKLKSTATDRDIEQPVKVTAAEVLKQIVADLTIAESACVASYGNIASDKGRINKFTVNAIQADVYLWMDDYTNCIAACDKIIASGKYGLVAGDGNWFNTLYVEGNSAEGIFELQFDSQALNPYFPLFGTGRPRYLANPGILESNYTTDQTNPDNKDIRGDNVAIHTSDQAIYKYIAMSPTTLRAQDASYAHWIFYRYADILLMKAEACIWADRGQETLDLINTIRARAKALPGSAQNPGINDKAALTTYLVAERGREFAFEGKRWYDLLRNAKRNNFARVDLLISSASLSVPSLSQQSAFGKIMDPNSLYFPIPKIEIQNNPNLVQNPFYK